MGNNGSFLLDALQHFQTVYDRRDCVNISGEGVRLGDVVTFKDHHFGVDGTGFNIWEDIPARICRKPRRREDHRYSNSGKRIFCHERSSHVGPVLRASLSHTAGFDLNINFNRAAAVFFKLLEDARFWFHKDKDIARCLAPIWAKVNELIQERFPNQDLYLVTGLYEGSGLIGNKEQSRRTCSLRIRISAAGEAACAVNWMMFDRNDSAISLIGSDEDQPIAPLLRLKAIKDIEKDINFYVGLSEICVQQQCGPNGIDQESKAAATNDSKNTPAEPAKHVEGTTYQLARFCSKYSSLPAGSINALIFGNSFNSGAVTGVQYQLEMCQKESVVAATGGAFANELFLKRSSKETKTERLNSFLQLDSGNYVWSRLEWEFATAHCFRTTTLRQHDDNKLDISHWIPETAAKKFMVRKRQRFEFSEITRSSKRNSGGPIIND